MGRWLDVFRACEVKWDLGAPGAFEKLVAPRLGTETAWFGRAEKVGQDLDESEGLLRMWKMADAIHDLESTLRHRLVRLVGVALGNDLVPFSPDDQRWHRVSEVKAIRGAH